MKHNQQIQKNASLHISASHSKQHKPSRFKRAIKETWQFVKHPIVAVSIGVTALSALSAAFTPASAQEKADRMFAANKPVASATNENKSEAKQVAKIEVPKESIKAELKDGYVEFADWVKNSGGTFTLKVDVREEVAKANGQIVKTELDGAVLFTADNGLFVVIPSKDGDGSSIALSSFREERILSKYVNVANKTLIILTDNEIGITNVITTGTVLFSDLNEKTPVKDAQVAQDPKDPNCAIVTGNGKRIARIHTNGPNPNEMVELISEPITMITK